MRVKLSKAAKVFFGKTSLETLYFEAIANALDANATKIEVDISVRNFKQPDTFTLIIKDNGVGFTDERFAKFSNLFDVEDTAHKGLGRLIYLCYFEKTAVLSNYNNSLCRSFEFSETFDEKFKCIEHDGKNPNGTTLSMSGYVPTKIAKIDYVRPKYLKEAVLKKFYPRLYKLKQSATRIEISISAMIDNVRKKKEVLSTDELPQFQSIKIEHSLNLFVRIDLLYHIEEVAQEDSSVITAIAVDDRTHSMDIIAQENVPMGYKMIFLLFSDYFNGQVDVGREIISIPESKQIEKIFRYNIAKIIEKLPMVAQRNQKKIQNLIDRFPHLYEYIDNESVGYASQGELLKKAQDKFFEDQRDVLEASMLTDEQLRLSIDMASKTLTEYVLFRQNVINKLKNIDKKDKESVIHNLIIPMRSEIKGANFNNDLYHNNIWVLDDKYMTYDTILSDEEMSKVIRAITKEDPIEKSDDRPDIAMIFSGNPNDESTDRKVDVVIVELKKKGISLEENSKVEIQLKKRAEKLLKYYNDRIQQIWFYGIVDFDDEFEKLIASEYHQLFSKGKVYYKSTEVIIQLQPRISFPIGIFLLDFDTMINDAGVRNSTFLNIIKRKINE
jgi:hypothetical protein